VSWILLVVAGLLEVVWAVGLKHTQGFTVFWPSVLTLGAMSAGFYLLSVAMRSLPLGTAYSIWVGIGAVGAAIAGIVLFKEPVNALKVISLIMVIAGIVGLKISAAA
jgi:quaternary ammonium compound-resistance protein SugE